MEKILEALEYRPENVRIIQAPNPSPYNGKPYWLVIDTDGTACGSGETYELAAQRARVRKGVIKAAISRRANKAKAAGR
jgi:hypothetical protein